MIRSEFAANALLQRATLPTWQQPAPVRAKAAARYFDSLVVIAVAVLSVVSFVITL